MISKTVLVAAGPFGAGLGAPDVARAIARGLSAGGLPEPDLCAIELQERPHAQELVALLRALDFDARMRRARAVVLAEWHLQERSLRDSVAFEIATRARQSGVPAYAVTSENALERFDTRMLDLQIVLEAEGERELADAGRKLVGLL